MQTVLQNQIGPVVERQIELSNMASPFHQNINLSPTVDNSLENAGGGYSIYLNTMRKINEKEG